MAPSGLSPLLPAYQRPLPAPSQQGGHSCHDTTVQQVAPATFSGWPSAPSGPGSHSPRGASQCGTASVSQSATELSWKWASVNTPNCQLGQLTSLGAHGPAVFLPLKNFPLPLFPFYLLCSQSLFIEPLLCARTCSPCWEQHRDVCPHGAEILSRVSDSKHNK